MRGLFEIIDDPEMVEKKIASGKPMPCMLMVPHATAVQIYHLNINFYVVDIVHEGKARVAVLCGCYRQKQPKAENGSGASTIGEKFLTFPKPCILLCEHLRLDVLSDMTKVWDIIDFAYEGKNRMGILCDYYTYKPNQRPEIKSQLWSLN